MATFVQRPGDEAATRARAAAAPSSKVSQRWILVATILGSSMAFIDGTVVNVALPALQTRLHASVVDVQWVVEAYALFLTALLLVGGSLGDRFGRRRVYLVGIALFAAASTWCGLANGVRELILARAWQGAGGALLVPGSLAIISSSFAESERGRAIGTWSGFTAITAALGPVFGGWLIEHISWRAVFFINLPIALIVIAIAFRHVPESRDEEESKPLDWLGAALVTLGLGGLVYGLIESSRFGFRNSAVIAALALGIILLIAFVYFENRAPHPMLPMSIFRSRNFTGANLLTLFLYAALSGMFFFLPLNLIQVQHYTPTAAGAALLPFILIMFSLSRWSGGLIVGYGAKLPLAIGPFIAAIGFALMALPGLGADYWRSFLPAVVVLGLGMAVSVAPLTTTVMNSVTANRAGIASGINNAASRAAGLLAIAVFGIVMLQIFNQSLERQLDKIDISLPARQSLDAERINLAAMRLPGEIPAAARENIRRAIDQSFVTGFRALMLIGAGLAGVSALCSLVLIDGRRSRSR